MCVRLHVGPDDMPFYNRPVPVVQIDLCRGILITFASKDEETRK